MGRHLDYTRTPTGEQRPEGVRRLKHLVLVIMEVMGMVRWCAMLHSLAHPEQILGAVITTRNMRERCFTAICLGNHPGFYLAMRVRTGMPGQLPGEALVVRLVAVRLGNADPRMRAYISQRNLHARKYEGAFAISVSTLTLLQ
jgi:hypothetical protein